MSRKNWEAVIGLETHVQLNTKTKIFSRAPNRFGDEPNTNITDVCTGQPGALPVLNREAVRKAVQLGCAIKAQIAKFSTFDRKSYFYPDNPRNFQITQFYEPIIIGGEITTDVEGETKTFTIEHVHLEDDAGMLKHFSNFAGVDFNRAGSPLVEIVSNPCMHSGKEAAAYGKAIKAIMQYIDASDCNMEEGSLRMDANISVRPKGAKELRTKVEIKNMNSFSNMEMAIEAEIDRQIREYERAGDLPVNQVIEQATFRWDPEKKTIIKMRSKEHAEDYRYFPEPDLVPIVLTDDYIAKVRATLPELPYERMNRYIAEYQITEYFAALLTLDKRLADFFEAAVAVAAHPRQVCSWITVEFFGRLKDTGLEFVTMGITPEHVGKLVNFIQDGTITGKIAKSVADEMVKHPGKDPEVIIKENPDFQPVSDTGEIEKVIDEVLSEQAQSVADFKSGKDKAFGFLMGQVMAKTRGKANPQVVTKILRDKLSQ